MIKAENGVIELIQQASVFVHRKGDSHTFWTINKGENLRHELQWDLLDSFYMGCFLMLCFVHIILFSLLRTYRANLYLAFPITAILLVSLLNEIFPGILQKGFCTLLYAWTVVFATLCVLGGTMILSYAARISGSVCFLRLDTMVRNDQPMQSKLLCGELTLNLGKSQALVNGTDLLLSQKEFTLLPLLVQSEGITQKSEELYEKVWNRPKLEDSGALKTAVSRLRKKIVDADLDIVIMRGEGYIFERQ